MQSFDIKFNLTKFHEKTLSVGFLEKQDQGKKIKNTKINTKIKNKKIRENKLNQHKYNIYKYTRY